jgi:hypothetical protein
MFNATALEHTERMEVLLYRSVTLALNRSGQLHRPSALTPGEEPPLPSEKKASWAQEEDLPYHEPHN